MKKRILLFLVLFLFVILFIFYESKKSYGDYEVRVVNSLNEDEYKELKVCLLNESKQLEVVNIKVKKDVDEISYILKLFDEHRNSLPLEYSTVLFENLNVESLKKENDKLYLEIEKLGPKTNLDSFLTSLMWSYKYLGIREIEVKISGTVYKINDDIKINTLYLSTKPSTISTYYELTENGIIPYTIIHEMNELELFMEMVGIFNKSSYKVVEGEKEVLLYLNDSYESVTDKMINELFYNLNLINSFKNVNIYLNNNLIDDLA